MFSTSVGLNWMAENDNLFHSRFGECNYTGSCQVVIANSMEEVKCLSRNSAPLLKSLIPMFVTRGGHSGVLLNETWITIWCAWQEWQNQPSWSCFGRSFALHVWHTHTHIRPFCHTRKIILTSSHALSPGQLTQVGGVWLQKIGCFGMGTRSCGIGMRLE